MEVVSDNPITNFIASMMENPEERDQRFYAALNRYQKDAVERVDNTFLECKTSDVIDRVRHIGGYPIRLGVTDDLVIANSYQTVIDLNKKLRESQSVHQKE